MAYLLQHLEGETKRTVQCDCIVALGRLNYPSDLFSSDIVRQMICRLPPNFHGKWVEFTLLREKRRNQHLWILRIGFKTEYWHLKKHIFSKAWIEGKLRHWRKTYWHKTDCSKCILCDNQHRFFKCNKY